MREGFQLELESKGGVFEYDDEMHTAAERAMLGK